MCTPHGTHHDFFEYIKYFTFTQVPTNLWNKWEIGSVIISKESILTRILAYDVGKIGYDFLKW